ncbi:MAG: alpha-L-arabinofuranosidase [Bacteroidales bacterium]|nr:alpha-L-arabinofuranosidase [Bacteroidales bacterium]
MKKNNIIIFISLFLLPCNGLKVISNEPDSVYIFAYATTKNNSHNGLHFAWSIDKKSWHAIGPEHMFLFCDYGRWGAEKKMFMPFLFQDQDQIWHCIWSLNDYDGVFAHAFTRDFIHWDPQDYPQVMKDNNCQEPEVHIDKSSGLYKISWLSTKNNMTLVFGCTSKDFKHYSETKQISEKDREDSREEVLIMGEAQTGTVHKVSWSMIDELIKRQKVAAYNTLLTNESFQDDSLRFKDLKPVEAIITADLTNSKKISDMLIGVFFEDINYAADGGLYAELVQNRSFEYDISDKIGRDATWTSTKAWNITGTAGIFTIDSSSPVHPNNKHYAILNIIEKGTGLSNEGFNGIVVKENELYDFSMFVRNPDNNKKKITIRLVAKNGSVVGKTSLDANSSNWGKVTGVIKAEKTIDDAKLEIIPQSEGIIEMDMISLFPQKTFKGHKNGLRPDLAQAIADLHPRFVRFPGGCVAHGDGLDNIYRWKNTIGPLEARKPQRNIWNYHQSYGLGFFEYFQFCEDIGAEPIPVIAAGVPCQNSSVGGAGQQGGIPMSDMDDYIQDILDLIEYCNGDVNTTWGKKRAEAGHPEPFNLKYIGIGNEDLITDIFRERFEMIYKAITKKYPGITVIGTVGPFNEGSDYEAGWKFATKLGLEIVDEHYYQRPGWFINNQDFYDRYDRSKSKVYLGEYASWGNTLYNALSEALYLASVERNADVVVMASYAPLLAKEGFIQWRTDLLFFTNTDIYPTPNYFVQHLYGINSGDTYIGTTIKLSDFNDKVQKRIGASIVHDSKTGDLIIKLANLLPVDVETTVNLPGVGKINPIASRTILTGNPGDRTVFPLTESIEISDSYTFTLPAYSFTVIRINPLDVK